MINREVMCATMPTDDMPAEHERLDCCSAVVSLTVESLEPLPERIHESF